MTQAQADRIIQLLEALGGVVTVGFISVAVLLVVLAVVVERGKR